MRTVNKFPRVNFFFGNAKEVENQYREIFGCNFGTPPFKYMGILIHFRKMKNEEWKPVEDQFEVKLSSWIGKLLSYGDRLILINSVLKSLPMFLLSFFEIHVRVWKRLNILDRFFWQDGHKKNIDSLSGILFADHETEEV
jgi:hypothetical protein